MLERIGPHFADFVFKCIYVIQNAYTFRQIPLNVVSKGPTENKSMLIVHFCPVFLSRTLTIPFADTLKFTSLKTEKTLVPEHNRRYFAYDYFQSILLYKSLLLINFH